MEIVMAHTNLLESVNEDSFFCGTCKQMFHSIELFMSHKNSDCNLKTNINELQNVSTTCGNTHISIDHKITLNNEDSNKTGLNCRFCKKKFKKDNTLQIHLKIHEEKPYQCPVCGRCFMQGSHLQRHISSHKVWPDGLSETTAKSAEVDVLSYSCLYCDLVMSNYNQFRSHLKNHQSLKKFKCVQGQCNSFYETVESLIHHVMNAHQPPSYSCHNCFKAFSSLEEIAVHYQSFNGTCIAESPQSEKYKCSQCDSVFTKADKLSLHLLTENHKKACIHCDKVFASDKRLRLHLQIHRTCKPFQCDICKQEFHVKKYLASHMLRHGEPQYTCTICKASFKRQDVLHRHMKSHQIRKVLKCPFKDTLNCKKEFTRRDKLSLHLKCHTKKISKRNTRKKRSPSDSDTAEIGIVPLNSEVSE